MRAVRTCFALVLEICSRKASKMWQFMAAWLLFIATCKYDVTAASETFKSNFAK